MELHLIPLQVEIDKINTQIRSTQFPRIMAFADVVTRYTEIVLKGKENQISWRSATAFIITGETLPPANWLHAAVEYSVSN
jgi:hypothetical protein